MTNNNAPDINPSNLPRLTESQFLGASYAVVGQANAQRINVIFQGSSLPLSPADNLNNQERSL